MSKEHKWQREVSKESKVHCMDRILGKIDLRVIIALLEFQVDFRSN